MRLPTAASVCLLAMLALAACTSAKDVLEPSAIAPADQAAGEPVNGAAGTSSATASLPAGPIRTDARVQVAPIVGASVEAAAPLTERLALRTRERGITLAGSTDTAPATIVLRGYFSVMSEGSDTTVVYVWDVYDPQGNRLHRITGQQTAATAGRQEGWPAVTPKTMQDIADKTVDQLALWLSSRAG